MTKSIEDLVEDYSTKPVPGHLTTNGFHIALINAGLVLSLLSMFTGVLFGLAIGVRNTIYVTMISSVFLVVVGTIAGIAGSKVRLSSYMLMKFSFGMKGAIVINFILAISLLGWFGVTLDLLGDGAQGLAQQVFNVALPKWVYMIAGGAVMTITAIFGFKGLDTIASWLTPIMALTLAMIIYKVFQVTTWSELMAFEPSGELTVGVAISAAIGSLISMMIAMPDFTRYAKTPFDSFIATSVPLLIAQPFVYVGAAMAAIAYQNDDILLIMLESGLGLFAFLLVIASSWISNTINLYSCSLGLSSILLNVKKWKLEVVSGVVGTLLAIAGIMDHFITFLELMSFVFIPAGSIYLSDYYIVKRQKYDFEKISDGSPVSMPAMIALLIGITAYYFSAEGFFSMTSLSSIDALIVTSATYLVAQQGWFDGFSES